MNDDIYRELESFDSDYHAEDAGVRRAGLDAIADGDHRFEIQAARLDRSQKQGLLLFVVSIRNLSDGLELDWSQALKTQQNADILGSTLTRLGVPAHTWKPFSKGLRAMIESKVLVGVRFHGKKVTKDGHANLWVQALLGHSGSRSSAPASAPSSAPPSTPAPLPSYRSTSTSMMGDDCPF